MGIMVTVATASSLAKEIGDFSIVDAGKACSNEGNKED